MAYGVSSRFQSEVDLDNLLLLFTDLNEKGEPQFFLQVFAKNSLIKNIFEEEKKFDSGTRSFFGK